MVLDTFEPMPVLLKTGSVPVITRPSSCKVKQAQFKHKSLPGVNKSNLIILISGSHYDMLYIQEIYWC